MRKIAAIILFACLTVPYLGTVWLHYQKSVVRKEIKRQMIAGIDKEELVLLRFSIKESKNNLRWEHSDEFEYDGEMFDVVQSEMKGDSIFYRCWLDRKETKLNKQLDNIVTQAMECNQQHKEQQKRLANFFKEFSHTIAFNRNTDLHLTEKSAELFLLSSYTSITFSPPDPPPRKA